MITGQTLRDHSTLTPETALVRIIQIYKRPSLDVPFASNNQDWFRHMLETYHKTGQRYQEEIYSLDQLTLTHKLYWITEEHWLAASRGDPVPVANEIRVMAHCDANGIKHSKIREIKKDGIWWSSVIHQDGDKFQYPSIGGMMTTQILLPDSTAVKLLKDNT